LIRAVALCRALDVAEKDDRKAAAAALVARREIERARSVSRRFSAR